MTDQYHVIVWIDHCEAKIFRKVGARELLGRTPSRAGEADLRC
jgi:hypothetical protein